MNAVLFSPFENHTDAHTSTEQPGVVAELRVPTLKNRTFIRLVFFPIIPLMTSYAAKPEHIVMPIIRPIRSKESRLGLATYILNQRDDGS